MENLLLKYLIAFIVGLLFGIEREIKHKPAGMRTHILVSLGSLTFSLLAINSFGIEAARIIANILVGIGFIGAGTIMKYEDKVIGLTTAASLWIVAAIAPAIALELYEIVILSTIFGLLTLVLKPIENLLRKIEG